MIEMVGKVAICQNGVTGLVQSLGRDSLGGPLYRGVCLSSDKIGRLWQSSKPKLVGTLDEWVKLRYAEIIN